MSVKIKLATIAGCIVTSFFACGANPVAAQDAYLARIYGDGVHQYFRNDSSTAKCRFDTVINEGSRDPRAYYFRALIALEVGDSSTADSDIRMGARYELEGRGTYDIWSSLARVQGPHRVKFECHRNAALLALRKQSVINRYPLNDSRDPERLRTPANPYRTGFEPNVPSILGDDPFMNEDQPPTAPLSIDKDDDRSDLDPGDTLSDEDFDAMDETQPEVDSDDPFGNDTMDDGSVEELPDSTEPAGDDPMAEDAGADDPFSGDDTGAGDMEADDAAPAGDGVDDEDPFADDGDDPFGDIFE